MRALRWDDESNIFGVTAVIQIEGRGGPNAMQGIMIFKSISEALSSGFQYFDRTKEGYLVRKMTPRGWALAIARCDE